MDDAERRRERAKREDLRLWLAKFYLGGRCQVCGTRELLEFDHIDPATKLFEISVGAITAPEVRFWEEVQKCQLLCTQHHREKSDREAKTRALATPVPATKPPSASGRRRRFTPEQDQMLLKRYQEDGVRLQDLADEFGSNPATIRAAIIRARGRPSQQDQDHQ